MGNLNEFESWIMKFNRQWLGCKYQQTRGSGQQTMGDNMETTTIRGRLLCPTMVTFEMPPIYCIDEKNDGSPLKQPFDSSFKGCLSFFAVGVLGCFSHIIGHHGSTCNFWDCWSAKYLEVYVYRWRSSVVPRMFTHIAVWSLGVVLIGKSSKDQRMLI